MLHNFVESGNTVVVVEHNLEVIKTADWVIDLGPEGGEAGGRIVAAGTPEEIAQCKESHTGRSLKKYLADQQRLREASLAPGPPDPCPLYQPLAARPSSPTSPNTSRSAARSSIILKTSMSISPATN